MRWPGRMAGEVLRNITGKRATGNDPAEKVELAPSSRGKIVFHAARCVGCKLCERECPAGALEINKVGHERFEAVFHLGNCIFCAQCVDSCNKDAMESAAD